MRKSGTKATLNKVLVYITLYERQIIRKKKDIPNLKSMYPSPPLITSISDLLMCNGKSDNGDIGTDTKNFTASR